jgi:hypothetical protein
MVGSRRETLAGRLLRKTLLQCYFALKALLGSDDHERLGACPRFGFWQAVQLVKRKTATDFNPTMILFHYLGRRMRRAFQRNLKPGKMLRTESASKCID